MTAAANLSVAVEEDSVIGLIGGNGAGKTTFINMVTGYLKPDSGSVHFDGREITAMPPRRLVRLGISRSFQIPQLFNSLTAEENLAVGLNIAARSSRGMAETGADRLTAQEAARAILKRFRLYDDYRASAAGVLPEGTRKLLDIAMAMVARPRVLLLDEPTSGVSSEEKFPIMDIVMEAVRSEGITVLFVEHDMDIVSRYAHRVLAFYDGRIIADAPPESVLNDVEVRRYVIGGEPHKVKFVDGSVPC